MIKVSIIIPVYNVEKYLHKCVDSILCQTFADFELILINDGSKDSSGDICDEYAQKDSRIVVIHKENGGVSTARNRGLEVMRGEYVTFIDSDDYISPYYLENFFHLNIDSEYVYIRQKVYFEAEDCIFNEPPRVFPNAVIFTNDNFRSNFIKYDFMSYCAPWAKLYSASIIKEHTLTFPVGLNFNEDHYFVIRYITALVQKRGFFAYIEVPQYHYMKRNNDSLSYKSRPVAEDCAIAFMLSSAMSDCFKVLNLQDKSYEERVISIPWERLKDAVLHSNSKDDVEHIYETLSKTRYIWVAYKLGSVFHTRLKDLLINTPKWRFSITVSIVKLVMKMHYMIYLAKNSSKR